jgi:hypothetical protein
MNTEQTFPSGYVVIQQEPATGNQYPVAWFLTPADADAWVRYNQLNNPTYDPVPEVKLVKLTTAMWQLWVERQESRNQFWESQGMTA